MSEQDATQSSIKQRRSRKTSVAYQQNAQANTVQRPTTDDTEAWKAYWEAQGKSWRKEPEINEERQAYLAERRSITPDIEQGIYPFKDVKLSRADVEWLIDTHKVEPRPIIRSDEGQRERRGLDLRGADLRRVNLHGLPLEDLTAGFNTDRWSPRHEALIQQAMTHLEEVDLSEAHLEGANLRWVRLEEADLRNVHLEGADLQYAHLEGADLREAHLEGANARETFMVRANLRKAHLEAADLRYIHFEGANLRYAHLDGKHLDSGGAEEIQNWVKNAPIDLPPADLREVFFDEATNLGNIILGSNTHGFVQLSDVHWGNTNLSYVNWSLVRMLGDERVARQKRDQGKVKDKIRRLNEYENAVRANRQLSTVLHNQGLNEDADHFAYRAQVLQRTVLWRQHEIGRWLFSLLLAVLSGYGYRIWRILALYLLTISIFALAYFVLGMHYSPYLPLDQAFLESITALHGRVFFEQFNPHSPQIWLTALEAVAGLIIEGVFIAMLIQRFFGK
jgi:uncharacterized protein YjbI with pentapeptide repeats